MVKTKAKIKGLSCPSSLHTPELEPVPRSRRT
jgi:hypothetical protein